MHSYTRSAEVSTSNSQKLGNVLPPSTECAIFVAPTAKELAKVKVVDTSVGQGCLVILLNPRALEWDEQGNKVDREVFNFDNFKDVYSLQTAKGNKDVMQYHEWGRGYVLATRPRREGGEAGNGGNFFQGEGKPSETNNDASFCTYLDPPKPTQNSQILSTRLPGQGVSREGRLLRRRAGLYHSRKARLSRQLQSGRKGGRKRGEG